MGGDPESVPALDQTSLVVTPMHTRYTFQGHGVEIELSFFTPAFLNDLDLLSRPVTYVTWAVHSTDSVMHSVEVLLVAGAEMATGYPGQPVVFSRHRTANTQALSVGTRDQAVLNRSGDDCESTGAILMSLYPTRNHPRRQSPYDLARPS